MNRRFMILGWPETISNHSIEQMQLQRRRKVLSQEVLSAPLVELLHLLDSVPPSLVSEELPLDTKSAKKERKYKNQGWKLVTLKQL